MLYTKNSGIITIKTNIVQNIFRVLLGLLMILPGIGHLTFQRAEFLTQVPDWIPLTKDFVVIASGLMEIVIGLSMIFWTRQKVRVGIALAIFFVLIFPGNITQYMNGSDAFGLDTDQKRFIRLFFQPVLMLWTLWSTGALKYLVSRYKQTETT